MLKQLRRIWEIFPPPKTIGPTNGFVMTASKHDLPILIVIIVLVIGFYFMRWAK